MKHKTLGDDVLIDLGKGIVGQLDGATSESRQDILDAVELQESVEEDGGSYTKSAPVVGDRNKGERTEKEIVGAGAAGAGTDPLLRV